MQGKETDRSTYDINKASRFEFTMYLDRVTGVGGEIRLEGRGVLCTKTGCENAYTTPVRFLTGKPLDRQIEAVKRTDRAVDYIKQRCPGRPY